LPTGIIVDVSQRNLRAAGVWIKSHAEAIFNTTYWSITPEEGETVRFTQTPDAFYISTLYAPNDTLVLTSPVPYVQGDEVTVVGGNASGTVVPSELSADGKLTLTISEDVRNADEYAWVFKIAYGGRNSSGGGAGGEGVGNGSGGGAANGAHILGSSSVLGLGVSLGMMLFLL
jgi:alpha-L-fucosidase